ncbi:MAG TPA: T9SS type A sorting domain-containing protein [Bacteroidia bacterium]|jgi:hypothetical protein|nr:T9SS type A sorting domain-containing protein [Bacteroidia bacterium]
MKKLALIFPLFAFSMTAMANDLTATVTNPTPGKSDGGIDLTVSGGVAPYTYSWVGPNGSLGTSEDINNLPEGNYTVTVTDKYCGTAKLTIKLPSSTVGISTVSNQHNVSVSPNPTADLFTIHTDESLNNATVILLSINGQIVQQHENISGTDFKIDASSLNSGVYFLEVIAENKISRVKLLKN